MTWYIKTLRVRVGAEGQDGAWNGGGGGGGDCHVLP